MDDKRLVVVSRKYHLTVGEILELIRLELKIEPGKPFDVRWDSSDYSVYGVDITVTDEYKT